MIDHFSGRKKMKSISRLLLCLIIFSSMSLFADDPAEMRAVYVATYDLNTQSKCDTIISNVLSANINAVFVEVRARADSYYYPNREDSTYSNSEPRGELYSITPSDLDVLQYFIDKCHNATQPVEVHAWCTTFNSWNRSYSPSSPEHVYNKHPEWISENIDGVTFTYDDDAPLDPGIPEVHDHIYNVFMDIVRNYDIDGIHFDYIRLLSSNSGYDSVAKAQFKAETGWDIDQDNDNGELDEVYEAWRRDQISQIVQRVHTQSNLEKPWVDVSAFLVNFSDSIEVLGQGYNWWVAHNAIDVLHPGCYSSSTSGTIEDWQFYISKLSQNGDQNKRPMVCAIGDYLLTDTNENAAAVNDLSNESRKPNGYNFFDYGSVFVDNSGVHADNLFDTGGPFDDWAPVPASDFKDGQETTLPNAPTGANADDSSGYPVITFQRPAMASDGDYPIHYRLYRSDTAPVIPYYENMIMEWWDETSARTSYTYADSSAPAGSWYYKIIAYDDWNNAAEISLGPASSTPSEYIIEASDSGLNNSDYSEMAGTFFNSSSHSSAEGCTSGAGSRFSIPSDGKNDRARFTPTNPASGTYEVYATCFGYASANAPGITVRIFDSDGTSTSTFDLTNTNCGNTWESCGSINYQPGQSHYIEFDSSTQTNSGSNDRMNPAAVKLVRVAGGQSNREKEPKPPVIIPASTITEVIADSHPQALDYDDNGNTWANSTYSGYYNGNTRFYDDDNTFPITDYAVWIIDLPQEGKWAIDGWTRYNNTTFATRAQYRFVDGSGTIRSTEANQKSTSNSLTSGDWLIDIDGQTDSNAYHFPKGRVYVTIYGNAAGSAILIADAVRFRFIEETQVNNWEMYNK